MGKWHVCCMLLDKCPEEKMPTATNLIQTQRDARTNDENILSEVLASLEIPKHRFQQWKKCETKCETSPTGICPRVAVFQLNRQGNLE